MSHSRSQETAADQIAVRLLHATGNTVAGMLKFFDHSMRKQFSDEYQTYQYAMTHPLGKDRLNTMRVALQTEHNRYGSTELERKVYSRIVAKLNALLESPGTVLKLNRKNLDPFARNYEIAIALYRLSQFTEAVRKIDELIAIEPNNPYLYQIKGQFLFEHGKGLEAVRAYQKALEYLPNDILLIAEYAVTLVNSVDLMKSEQDKQEALTKVIKLLKRVTDRDLKNPYIYRNLAIAYGKLGDLANSNLMLAEEALEYGRIEEAHRFALKAKKHCSHDAKVKLKIDDILKALQDARNDDRRSGH
jgi:predicted Zn-dependent protease